MLARWDAEEGHYLSICETCGDEFDSKPGKRFCSRDCQLRFRNGGEPKKGSDPKKSEYVDVVARMLEQNGIPIEDIGSVSAVKINEWQGMVKGEDGEPRVIDMRAASLVLHPSWETGPRWPVVQPAKPVTVRVPKRRGPLLVGTYKTLVFLPDEQIGYRRLPSGILDPFHDPRAIDIALQIAELERPDTIIHAGDLNDFAPFSKHRQEPGFAMTVQPAIQYAYEYLARLSEITRDHRVVSGNHDIRLQNYTIDNAMASFGLTRARAGGVPEAWPVMSVQNLLRFDELGIEYVGSYPSGATYVNDNLAVIHGAKIGNKMRTAAQIVVEDERVSILHGHTHKRALAAKTRNSRGAAKFSMAYSPGCLCRIDGAVPSTKGQIDAHGVPVRAWEDWQQGVAVIRYQEGDGKFHLEEVPIFEERDGSSWAMHGGQEFTSVEALGVAA